MLKLIRNAYHAWLAKAYLTEYEATDRSALDLRAGLMVAYQRHARKVN